MKQLYVFTILLTLLGSFLACDHEAELPPPDQPPVGSITFYSPSEGAVYRLGDTVTIEATALSTADIHGYTVSVARAGDTTTYFRQEVHAHNDTLLIRHSWSDTLTTSAALEARVTIVLDHNGNTLTGKRVFRHE